MHVRFDEARHDRTALRVDDLGGRSLEIFDCRAVADGEDGAVLDGNRLGARDCPHPWSEHAPLMTIRSAVGRHDCLASLIAYGIARRLGMSVPARHGRLAQQLVKATWRAKLSDTTGRRDIATERNLMKTVYSPLHAGHAGQMELVTAAIVPGFEKPSRAEFIKARVESEKLGPIIATGRARSRRRQAHPQGRLHRLPADGLAAMDGSRLQGLGDALHLADARPARRRAAEAHRRPARLLFLRRRRHLRRRHLGRDQVVL